VHLLIMTGYSSVFLMVVVFLRWFQRDAVIDPEWPVVTAIMTLVGYYATFAIMYGTSYRPLGPDQKDQAALPPQPLHRLDVPDPACSSPL
jgi:hypothetical protein